MLFTDESGYRLNINFRNVLIWKKESTRNLHCLVRELTCFCDRGLIYFWEGIITNDRTELHILSASSVTTRIYIEKVSEFQVWYFKGCCWPKDFTNGWQCSVTSIVCGLRILAKRRYLLNELTILLIRLKPDWACMGAGTFSTSNYFPEAEKCTFRRATWNSIRLYQHLGKVYEMKMWCPISPYTVLKKFHKRSLNFSIIFINLVLIPIFWEKSTAKNCNLLLTSTFYKFLLIFFY